MADDIVSGDIVRLKTSPNDRPEMVVNQFQGHTGSYSCVWWNSGTNEYKQLEFHPAAIEKVNKADSDQHDRLNTLQ